ncbi:hypothetical protein Misp03_79540 [Microbispora sp. NBRC 16548]|nr:hypothetical protein Misp03_79540 [Microbispora sp. NBRC 16548]
MTGDVGSAGAWAGASGSAWGAGAEHAEASSVPASSKAPAATDLIFIGGWTFLEHLAPALQIWENAFRTISLLWK